MNPYSSGNRLAPLHGVSAQLSSLPPNDAQLWLWLRSIGCLSERLPAPGLLLLVTDDPALLGSYVISMNTAKGVRRTFQERQDESGFSGQVQTHPPAETSRTVTPPGPHSPKLEDVHLHHPTPAAAYDTDVTSPHQAALTCGNSISNMLHK